MKKKTMSIWLVVLLIGAIFTVVFFSNVSAMNDEQNLSGLVWQADGTPPTSTTNFCIWVNHSGVWERFPVTGWAQTEIGAYGFSWYSYVLPDEDYGSRWDHWDTYRIQVDGTPWGNYDGNATSNGTGSDIGTFPLTYEPTNPSNTFANINYSAGGGYLNEQQWDVRTVAPVDLAPTNITANGMRPEDYIVTGMPVGQGEMVTIIFNVTNFGLISTGIPFNVTLWNCSATGVNNPEPLLWEFIGEGPLNDYGNTSGPGYDTGVLIVTWVAPSSIGDYYINITVDSGYEIPEYDETNNTVIIHFKIGPDLIPDNVLVEGSPPTDPVYVGPGEIIRIDANATNIGFSGTGVGFNMALYQITGLGGSWIPGTEDIKSMGALPAGNSANETWYWVVPSTEGDYYMNISVDFPLPGSVDESNENNNDFTIHFVVAPDLWIQNVSVEGTLVTDINGVQILNVIILPMQPITIMVNGTNIGPSSTGIYDFNITYTNCSASGDTGGNAPFFNSPAIPPLPSGGVSSDIQFTWIAPGFTGILDYYINITIDYGNNVSESDEGNNYFILRLLMDAPDLTPDEVSVEVAGSTIANFLDPYNLMPPFVSDIVEVPRGQDVIIWITVGNIGGANMTEDTNVTFYNVSGVGGPPIDPQFDEAFLSAPLNAGETAIVFGIWTNPGIDGMYYINISIDYNGTLDIYGRILELNEFNNTFTLIINVTPIPITVFTTGDPTFEYNTTVRYINSTTEINLTVQGGTGTNYTWYRVYNMTNGSYATDWINYSDPIGGGNFTMAWGESTFRIGYNSTDSVGAKELTKYRIVIVDDKPPVTTIDIAEPRHRDMGTDDWNITSNTQITLNATDHPLGMSIIGIYNASGIGDDDVPESGIFYRVWSVSGGTYVRDWTKLSIISSVGGLYTAAPFTLPMAWADGYYIIEYNSTDNLKQKEPINYITVYLDNTGPVTTITVGDPKHPHPSFDWYIRSTTPLTLIAIETSEPDGSGVNNATIQFRIINTDTSNTDGWVLGTAFNVAINYTYWAVERDGNYTIYFRSRDNLDNWGPTDWIDVYVDDTPPVAVLVVDEPKYRDPLNVTHRWNISSETYLSFSANDDTYGSGLNYTDYHYYNATYDSGWQRYTGLFQIPSTLNDGIYTVEFISYDRLYNNATFNESVYLDNTPPTTTIPDIYPFDPRYRAHVSHRWNITSDSIFGFDASDGEGCGVAFSEFRVLSEDTQQPITDWLPTETFTLSGPQFELDGNYIIEYRSEDHVENTEDGKFYYVYLDNTGPISNITSDSAVEKYANRWEIDDSTLFSMSADDGLGCGVEFIYYRFDNMGWQMMTWSDYTGAMSFAELFPSLNFDDIPWNHSIDIRGQDYLGNDGPIASYLIYIEGDITPPLPPVLRVYVRGEDIYLEWIPSPDEDIHHYLIYMSENKTDFDFSDVWVDTSIDDDQGVLPLRTTWNHTNAVITALEYYYTIRGVDGRNNIGYTSNIAGKVTLSFEKGYNTFSLPLEPFESTSASEMLGSEVFLDETDTIYRYNASSQKWLGHPKFLPSSLNDFTLEFGEGYMIYISETKVEYTFTGATGTSIRYIGGVGDELAFRESLTVEVEEDGVQLTWTQATDAAGYSIYRGSARMEEGSLTDFSIEPVHEASGSDTNWTDTIETVDELYYMVVAKGGQGEEESSTYAIGVKTVVFKPGYSLFSLQLEPQTASTISWFAKDMFLLDTNALYYYDEGLGSWQGHPRFLPENINNVNVYMGKAYIAYVHERDVSYAFIGV